jgi:hypothetical protein
MNDDLKTSFVTYYIRSLAERTREERTGTKFGFDWVVYNVALSASWTPHRLPFLRSGADETSKTKTEPEFGVDLAFISPDRQTLYVFVLKDEVLNNANWAANDFDTDLRNASAPDLSSPELKEIKTVEVILAYNKDEDRAGIELFDRRVSAQGTKLGDSVELRFDRWNLTTIVEKTCASLLSPSLLPQKFFSHFSYICAQVQDFVHGSDEWTFQLIPNWRRFLDALLSEKADERCVRLLPVALIILQEYGKGRATAETGWIDLIEWGMLGAWKVLQNSDNAAVRRAVAEMWVDFYLSELHRYYHAHAEHLATKFSLERPRSGSFVDTVASAIVAHWHLARLGMLSLGYAECLPRDSAEQQDSRTQALNTVADWLCGFLIANPSSMRPVLDIHHIEQFLTWGTLRLANRLEDMHSWMVMLANRLSMRRIGHAQIPFIEGRNSTELVFEYIATGEKPDEFCDQSSVYLTCLMELVCSLPTEQRNSLLELIYRRIVQGKADGGTQIEGCEPIDLMFWHPPIDWGQRVLIKTLANEGECVAVRFGTFGNPEPSTGEEILRSIESLVAETRSKRQFAFPEGLPLSAIVLACLKHRTPLPTELWRQAIFKAVPKPEGPT